MRSVFWKMYAAMDTIVYWCKLNIAFLLSVLMGGIIFGIAPGLLTITQMVRQNQLKEHPPFIATYWHEYWRAFKTGNLVLLPVMVALSSAIYLLFGYHGHLPMAMMIALVISAVLLLMMIMVITAMYAYYQLSWRRFMRQALVFVGYNFLILLIPLIWLYICYTISMLVPGLLLFFSFGVWAYLNMGIFAKIFDDNERKVQTRMKQAQ